MAEIRNPKAEGLNPEGNPKSEAPKSEGNPKSEIQNPKSASGPSFGAVVACHGSACGLSIER